MSDSASDSGGCYRHPNRESFVLCQRCGRTICPQCQIQAAVGVQCPECVREAHRSTRRPSTVVAAFRSSGDRPVVSYSIMALCVVVWLLQVLPGSVVTQNFLYYPLFTGSEPWRMITAIFLHSPSSVFHLLVNMYSLFIFGRVLEQLLGRIRFLALFLISGFSGSVAVLVFDPFGAVVGASGAVFGLMGAFLIIQRKLGGNSLQMLIVIGINLVIGFLPGLNISWQAHVGGLIAGSAVALAYLRMRRPEQRNGQILLVGAVPVVLIVITVLAVARIGTL